MNWRFVTLSLAAIAGAVLLAWASTRHTAHWDWTASGRHTLSPASRSLLQQLDGPVEVTAFVADDPKVRRAIVDLVARYQALKPGIELRFVDPKQHPDQARAAGIAAGGELVLRYGDRRTKLRLADESHFSAALLQLLRNHEAWVVFIDGHGERDPHGKANHDLARFAASLGERGAHVQTLNLADAGTIPDNTGVVVLSAPRTPWQRREVDALLGYLERGGDLLWLGDPGTQPGLENLSAALGVQWLPGIVLSAHSAQLGVKNPAFLVTALARGSHLQARGLDTILLPVAAALTGAPRQGWNLRPLLRSDAESWTETGPLDRQPLRFNPEAGEQRGPLNLGLSLTRVRGPREQRVAVLGDGDFLSNAYLANGANLDLGVALIHWLDHQDVLAEVTTAKAADLQLQLDSRQLALLAWGFPLVLPLLLVVTGAALVWARRRH